MRNYPEWVISFAAILSIGAISVSLNAWWTEDELDYAINDSGLSVLIADSERVDRALRPCERVGARLLGVRLPERISSLNGRTVVGRGEKGCPDARRGARRRHRRDHSVHLGNDRIPEGRRVDARGDLPDDHGLLLQRDDSSRPTRRSRSGQRTSAVFHFDRAPLHVTGCIPVMMSCFSWHFKLVMMYRWDPERALALIERHQVTAFVGVPTQGLGPYGVAEFRARYDTSTLASVGGGGAPAPSTLVARVESTFTHGRPSLGYGMTETNAYGPQNFGDDYITHPASTGRVPTIVMDVDIRDESSHSLPVGNSGEIWMKSPTLIRGYWNKPDATAATIVEGWLRTGDLGHISEEGFLFIEDRAKDMIIRAGENVYSAQVESAMYENPAVYEVAVFGLSHERLGEEVAAVVMVRDGMELTSDELRHFLSTRLAAFMIPTRVAFTREPLPRNPAGKFMKREMPEAYFSSAS